MFNGIGDIEMEVKPQKNSSKSKYPNASDIAKKCAMVAAGALTATSLLGFIYNSDIPCKLGIRTDAHQLSEVFSQNELIAVNASGTRKLHCKVVSIDEDIRNIGTVEKGNLRGFDLSYVVIDNLKIKSIEEGSELYELVKDYQLYELKDGGVVILPKESQHYYILGDSPENMNYITNFRDEYGKAAVFWSGFGNYSADNSELYGENTLSHPLL